VIFAPALHALFENPKNISILIVCACLTARLWKVNDNHTLRCTIYNQFITFGTLDIFLLLNEGEFFFHCPVPFAVTGPEIVN
jgi:hypothetical protein